MTEEKVELIIEMATSACEYIDTLMPSSVPVNVFRQLVAELPYKQKIDDFNAPDIVNKCLELKNKTNEYASVCKAMSLEAKRNANRSYSHASLFGILEDEKMKGITTTEGNKKNYAELNDDYQKYIDLHNAWVSLMDYFTRLHDDITDNYYFYKRVFEQKITKEEL